ncbi:unnamed protein product [Diamesa serratosioi]
MEISLIDMENSCRTCLLQFNRDDLESIFEDTFEDLEIFNILKLVAPISINECLSSMICEDCKNNAINAFKFRQLCISSDENIRNIHCLNKKAPLEHTFKREMIDDEGLLNDGSIDGGDLEGDLDLSEYLLNTHKESEPEEDDDNEELLEETIIETKPDLFKPSQRRSYSCSICSFKQDFRSSAIERPKKFRCPICLKDWVSPSKLKRHMATHLVKDIKIQHSSYKSDPVESTEYSSDTSLGVFKKEPYSFPIAHKIDKNYICTICNKTWLTPSKLAAHMQSHIKQEQKQRHTSSGSGSISSQKQPNAKNVCPICEKVCVSPSKLQRHMGSHNRNKTNSVSARPPRPKNYSCPVCGKCFESPSKVTRHLNVHAVSMITDDIIEEVPILGD